jgi:hypothetical protein
LYFINVSLLRLKPYEVQKMLRYPRFQPSPIRVGHPSAFFPQRAIDRPKPQRVECHEFQMELGRVPQQQERVLGFKGGVLPPMSPTPTPKPQPAPKPKEGPSFPSTLDLAGGRPRGPLRPPPPMPPARLRDAFWTHARTLRHWLTAERNQRGQRYERLILRGDSR